MFRLVLCVCVCVWLRLANLRIRVTLFIYTCICGQLTKEKCHFANYIFVSSKYCPVT